MKVRALISAALILFPVTAATSDDCVCPKTPLWQIDAYNYMHYAMCCQLGPTGCTDSYPTGFVGPYSNRMYGLLPHGICRTVLHWSFM